MLLAEAPSGELLPSTRVESTGRPPKGRPVETVRRIPVCRLPISDLPKPNTI